MALLILAVAGGAAAQSEAPKGKDFDPWAGIDKDGRIPKIEKPADLEHPDRWRYIPAGRLKPGNLFQRFLVSSFIAPFVFRDTDVGFGGGLALTDIDFRQQRRRELLGLFLSYTAEGQQAYTAVWRRWLHHRELPNGGVLQEERSFLRAVAGYENSLTRRFFGLGADTKESAESSYSDQTAFARFGFELAVPDPGDNVVVGASLRGEWHDLGRGEVGGKPDTKDAFPVAFALADDTWLVWLETELRYDTKDSQRLPYEGFDVGAKIDAALLQNDWNVGAVFSLFGSKFFALPGLLHDGGDPDEENPPTDVLAFNLKTRTTAGDLPFYALPSLGGSRTLRGFIQGRFRDRSLWHLSAEYRFWVLPRGFPIPFTETLRVERTGLTIFGDVGSVADDWWDLFSAKVRPVIGIGVVATLERAAPFRVDIGFSSEGVEVTAGFGLAF